MIAGREGYTVIQDGTWKDIFRRKAIGRDKKANQETQTPTSKSSKRVA